MRVKEELSTFFPLFLLGFKSRDSYSDSLLGGLKQHLSQVGHAEGKSSADKRLLPSCCTETRVVLLLLVLSVALCGCRGQPEART